MSMSVSFQEWICTLKMNGQVYALAFSPDSELLYSHGEDGQVVPSFVGGRRPL